MSNKQKGILADGYAKTLADRRTFTNHTTNVAASLTDNSATEYATKCDGKFAINSASDVEANVSCTRYFIEFQITRSRIC